MNEVHRYKAVTMLSAAGATIGYDPHGPDVVMARDLDRVTAERDAALGREAAFNRQISNQAETIKQLSGRYGPIAEALQQRLTAADERVDVLVELLLQTNELLYAIQGDPGAVPSSAIDAMRGEVFTALKPAQEQPKP